MTPSRPTLLSEILGQAGVFDFLRNLRQEAPHDLAFLVNEMARCGVASREAVFPQLVENGILLQKGAEYYLSTAGFQAWLLLSALNGADLGEVLRQLRGLHPSLYPYEIVTEGMTTWFIDNLAAQPDFRHVYLCSPWIHLRPKVLRKFLYALYRAQRDGSEGRVRVTVICRPLEKEGPHYDAFHRTLDALVRLGAECVVNRRLHSKLYIREPGPRSGLLLAIVGSENLTGRRNIELGIRIRNDTVIIQKLIKYFMELYARSEPHEEVRHA